MALETLKDVKEIDGFSVGRVGTEGWTGHRVYINDETNTIGFRIQNGPIKEVGVNGCQVDLLIEAARMIIEGLNEQYPCVENSRALQHLMSALGALHKRKEDRESRGVEGFNKP